MEPGQAEERGQHGQPALIQDTSNESGQNSSCIHARAFLKTLGQNDKFRLVMSLVLGQVLSLMLCGTGVTSQLLQSTHGIHVPTTQSFINYVLLTTVFGVSLAVRKDFVQVLRRNWWKYIILGVIDVEANYMIVRAYEYTNLTTIQLLDSFTIACVMVLSFFFLRVRYKLINLMGVSLALIGIVCLVLATLVGSGSQTGDLLCLGGSALYAISNVAQEFLVKNHSITEFLGLIGMTGSVVSAIQLVILERESLAKIDWSYDVGLLFFGFGVCMFTFYSVMPHVMKFSSAVVVNLSLLTADIYTLFFGLYLFHFVFSFFYVVAFFLIVTGVFIYNIRQPKASKKDKDVTASFVRNSKPPAPQPPPKELDLSRPVRRKRFILRELLESSTIETTTAEALPPIRKKKYRQRNSSTGTYPPTAESSPLAQSRVPWDPADTPISPSSYGSVSLVSTSPSVKSESTETLQSSQELRTHRPRRDVKASKSQLVSVTQYSTE
ncbi:solute carrier family 35 member F2-like isoform X2 [Halichondria panicea]|uniref:solute carrier family 35 member F2-like isoform X2 n=1 Tax=Halichondria panicea TaxID=6063 RepID=UPI00312BABB4